MSNPQVALESEIRANQESVRRRFLRALADLGLQRVVPATSVQMTDMGFAISGLSVGQLAQITNALDDAVNLVDVAVQSEPLLVGGLTQPDRLPVSFTPARVTPQTVLS